MKQLDNNFFYQCLKIDFKYILLFHDGQSVPPKTTINFLFAFRDVHQITSRIFPGLSLATIFREDSRIYCESVQHRRSFAMKSLLPRATFVLASKANTQIFMPL